MIEFIQQDSIWLCSTFEFVNQQYKHQLNIGFISDTRPKRLILEEIPQKARKYQTRIDKTRPFVTFLPEHSRFDHFRQVQEDQFSQEKTKIDQILVLKGTVRI